MIQLPVVAPTTTVDPTDRNRHTTTAYVPFSSIQLLADSKDFPWYDPRVFTEKPSGRLPNVIKKSAIDEPASFHRKSRGITVLASRVTVKDGRLRMEFDSDKMGLMDGGTTVSTLTRMGDELKDKNGFVPLRVIVGNYKPSEARLMSEGLNKSREVDNWDLANQADEFQWIKKAAKEQLPEVHISYATNEEGLDIGEIIRLLTLLMHDSPETAYSSIASTLKHFQNPKYRAEYKKLAPIFSDILRLADYIPQNAQAVYNNGNRKFGSLAIVEACQFGKVKDALTLTGAEVDFEISGAFQFPLLAAFSECINKNGDEFSWKTNPFRLFDRIGAQLITRLNKSFSNKEGEYTLNEAGKNGDVYELLRGIVRNEVR